MVDSDLVARKIARAEAHLSRVAKALDRDRSELLADAGARDLMSFYLLLAIQECVDLAAHWVADEGLTLPDDAASTFEVLARRDCISTADAETLRAAIGLRNRIAHGYAELDLARVAREAQDGLGALRRFLAGMAGAAGL